jgi:branched-chain amino acid transport system ATP-binding protein
MSEPLIRIDGLTAGYGSTPVIHDLNLTIEEGTLCAIVGPNGHGKTTLLKTISGLIKVFQGSVTFAGRDITHERVDRIVARGIVHVPQGDLVYPQMTVRDNLLMGGYLEGGSSQLEKRLETVFELFPKLEERQKQHANSLSGGERRMLGIGRGLMTNGRVVMIDEPSLGLAPIVIEQIYKVINLLMSEGRTIVIVEENVTRVTDLAKEIFLLDTGRFVWNGAPDDLMKNRELLKTYLGT